MAVIFELFFWHILSKSQQFLHYFTFYSLIRSSSPRNIEMNAKIVRKDSKPLGFLQDSSMSSYKYFS